MHLRPPGSLRLRIGGEHLVSSGQSDALSVDHATLNEARRLTVPRVLTGGQQRVVAASL